MLGFFEGCSSKAAKKGNGSFVRTEGAWKMANVHIEGTLNCARRHQMGRVLKIFLRSGRIGYRTSA